MRKPLKIQARMRHKALFNHLQEKKEQARRQVRENPERLVSAAIIRDGETHHGLKSHGAIRASLGDENPYDPDIHRPNDQEGFWTSKDRFVNRYEAWIIGNQAGQVADGRGGALLSSDVRW